MSKRPYKKKNTEYWEKRSRAQNLINSANDSGRNVSRATPISVSMASEDIYSSRRESTSRTRSPNLGVKRNDLKNIDAIKMPFGESGGFVSIKDCVQLCEKAYSRVSIFRETIEILTEFSAADIYLKGGNKKSRQFVKNWMERSKINVMAEEFFREYYRSGNVFIYRFDGSLKDKDFKKFKISLAAKRNSIPLRYVVLDPKGIVTYSSASYDKAEYSKVLNPHELESLRLKKTEEDQAIFNALPAELQRKISRKEWDKNGLDVKIDSSRLTPVFYKKQPYEPFAIPFGWPVLDDIDFKMELKKMDRHIAQTVEQVILLVTLGDEENGVDPAAMTAMEEIFSNESIGRVLVADWTTKAQFVIPDISKILDPKKYEVVNRDIQEGLHNILVGSEKFSNTMTKVEVFLERLKEGRKAFKRRFLQKEINSVCKNMGFKSIPTAHFQEIDLKDEAQRNRIYTRMLELGAFTPEQALKAMETGILPEQEDILESQEEFVKQRKKGFFNPLTGGTPMIAPPSDPNADKNTPAATQAGKHVSMKDGRPTKSETSKASAKKTYSVSALRKTSLSISKLISESEKKIKAKYKIKKLTDSQESLAFRLVSSVASRYDQAEWSGKLDSFISNPESIASLEDTDVLKEVNNISDEHDLDTFQASLLYHSQCQTQ